MAAREMDDAELAAGWYLTAPQLQFLRTVPYHYNAWSMSIIDRTVFQPFWSRLVKLVPERIPAIFLSLCGLSCSVSAACVTLVYSPTLSEPVPAWVFYFDAACVLIYHTFDGIDGKQAAKNRDSEIEELYDHGADTITSILQALMLAAALQLPAWAPFQAFGLLTLSLLAIFSTHLAADVTHTFVFTNFDVDEAQCILAGALALTGYFGQEFWQQPTVLNTPLATLFLSVTAISLISKILDGALTVAGVRETPLEAAGIAIPRRSPDFTSCFQIALVVTSGGVACYAGAMERDPVLFALQYGVGCAKICVQSMILSKVRAAPALMDSAMALAAISTTFYGLLSRSGMERTATLVLMTATVISVTDFLRLAVFATWDFENARRTRAFGLRGQEDLSTRSRNEGFYVTGGNLEETKARWIQFERGEVGLLEKMYR